MPKFSDSPYFVIKTLVKNLPYYNYEYPTKAKIHTLNNKIIAKGYGMDVYLKTPVDYEKIKLVPLSGTPTDNYFKFNLESDCYRPSKLTFDQIADYISKGYDEVYFLKALPSPLHSFVEYYSDNTWTKRYIQYTSSDTWTVNHRFNAWRNYRNESFFTITCTDLGGTSINYEYSKSIDENNIQIVFKEPQSGVATVSISNQQPLDYYVNNNKAYLYFGNINTEKTNTINVMFRGMKDYVMESLPYHNRTDLLTTFMEVSFDRFYQQIYHLINDVWNMQDPSEINIDFLHYIYLMFSMGQPTLLSETTQRQYAAALVDLMKRKGTYSSLYIIWKAIAGYSTNFLNVYERWHSWTVTDSPYGLFEDYLYTSYPLYDHTLPIGGAGSAYYGASTTTTGGEAIAFTTTSSQWNINHSLSTWNVIVQCFDANYEGIIPDEIEIIDANNIRLTFGRPVTGVVHLVDVNELGYGPEGTQWVITHSRGIKEVIAVPTDYNRTYMIPNRLTLDSASQYTVDWDSTSCEGRTFTKSATFVYTQSTASSSWSISHPYGIYVIVQIYDANYNMILPKTIKISNDLITITFDEAVSGYAVISKLASTRIYPENPFDTTDLVMSPHYRVEIDLSNEPTTTYEIMDENTINTLITEWEKMRPVCKFSHYSMVVSPKTNFSRFYIPMYPGGNYKANINTKCISVVDNPNEDCSIYWREHRNIRWIVAHRLHNMNVLVQCYDLDGNMIEPLRLTRIDQDYVEIIFSSPQAGYAYCCIADSSTALIPPSATWGLVHTIGQQFPLVQIDDENYGKLIPKTITMPSVNEYNVTFTHDQSGYGLLVEPEQIPSGSSYSYVHWQDTPAATWYVNHMFDAQAVQVTCYDEDNNVIYPGDVVLTTRNYCTITFRSAVKGKAVVRAIGRRGNLMSYIYEKLSYAHIGDGTSGIAWKPDKINSVESLIGVYSISRATDANYYYVKVIVDTDIEMTVREIAIFDINDKMCFYSYCSPIYKPANVDLYIWVRIQKTLEYNR
mgnify:FL=1